MIVYNPIDTLKICIIMLLYVFIILAMNSVGVEPILSVLGSFIICLCCVIIRTTYYRLLNRALLTEYIEEYRGEETAIKYFRKTIYAKKNKLAKKDNILNYEFKQMPKVLLAKKLNSRVRRKMDNDFIKIQFLTPYMYKVKYANLVLIANISANEFNDYITSISRDRLEEGMENIVLIYLENPSQKEYQIIKRKMNVNNYVVDGINVKLSFLVSDKNGFTLYDNYYFVDYSTDMIKDKYRIKSNVPIPCDKLTERVNTEIYTRLCGL